MKTNVTLREALPHFQNTPIRVFAVHDDPNIAVIEVTRNMNDYLDHELTYFGKSECSDCFIFEVKRTDKIEKITYAEMKKRFCEHEAAEANGLSGKHLTGCIVFTSDSFLEEYSVESRTYFVSSDNKAYKPNALGYSVFGSNVKGDDICVRLDRYMREEKGGARGWKVDFCYIV